MEARPTEALRPPPRPSAPLHPPVVPPAVDAPVPIGVAHRPSRRLGGEIRRPAPTSRQLAARSRGLAMALGFAVVALALSGWSLQRTSQALGRADRLAADLHSAQAEVGSLTERLSVLEDRHLDPTEVAERARPSVFTVVSDSGRGSAWVVGAEGGRSRLVTNFHVVGQGAGPGTPVQVVREELVFDAEVLVADEGRDLAVVEVDEDLPSLPVADDRPRVGDSVMVIGSPLGLEQSVVTGIVSAFRPSHLQISAPLNPGNSGGPVLDARGEVVGVAVLKVGDETTEAIGLAIPVAEVCAVTAC